MDWQLFVSIFSLIFVAELPDKTAFLLLLNSTKGHPLAIFGGTALAFLIQTVVAVTFGRLLALLPEQWVHIGAGVMFLGFAAHAWWSKDEDEAEADASAAKTDFWRAFSRAFLIIFIAEWGDLTQLATAGFAARYPAALFTIFVAALLALWSTTALIVFVGHKVKGLVSGPWLKRASVIAFAAIGIYFIVNALSAPKAPPPLSGEARLDRVLRAKNETGRGPVTTATLHGHKYILLNFWASWCPPCMAEMPALMRFTQTNKQFLLISVSEDSTNKEFDFVLKAFPTLESVSSLLVHDWDSSLGRDFGVEKLPESFVYSLNQHRFFQISGALDWDQNGVLDHIEKQFQPIVSN